MRRKRRRRRERGTDDRISVRKGEYVPSVIDKDNIDTYKQISIFLLSNGINDIPVYSMHFLFIHCLTLIQHARKPRISQPDKSEVFSLVLDHTHPSNKS